MINSVTLIGNLGKDPELRTLDNGKKVANVSLATNKNYKDGSGEWQTVTSWHNLVFWEKLAEQAGKYSKGAKLYIEGELSYRDYEDKDGNKKYVTDIVVRKAKLLDKKETSEDEGDYPF